MTPPGVNAPRPRLSRARMFSRVRQLGRDGSPSRPSLPLGALPLGEPRTAVSEKPPTPPHPACHHSTFVIGHSSFGGASRRRAFTLVELLVVIGILAVVAGGVVMVYDDVQARAEDGATRQRLAIARDALIRFRTDMGYYPGEGPLAPTRLDVSAYRYLDGENPSLELPALPALDRWAAHPMNFWMLFEKPVGKPPADVDPIPANTTERWTWDPAVSRGWRGPYLNDALGLRLDCAASPDGSPLLPSSASHRLYALADGYPRKASSAALRWVSENHPLVSPDQPVKTTRPAPGAPLLFKIDDTGARVPGWIVYELRSAGPDGIYSTDDDIVLEVSRRQMPST